MKSIESKKIILLFLLYIFMTATLSACSSASNSKKTDQKNLNLTENAIEQKKISIGPGCIGCGLCVRLDSEHFGFDSSSRLATVISQDNSGSKFVTAAIKNCPPRVISIN